MWTSGTTKPRGSRSATPAHVEPAVDQVLASYGIPHDHSMVTTERIDVIDIWRDRAV